MSIRSTPRKCRVRPLLGRHAEKLEEVIAEEALTVEPIPREALFLAGKVFLDYRRSASALNGLTGTGLMILDDTHLLKALYFGYSVTLAFGEVLMIAASATGG